MARFEARVKFYLMDISQSKKLVFGSLIILSQNWLKYQKCTNIWHQEANTGIKDGAGHTPDNLYEIVKGP